MTNLQPTAEARKLAEIRADAETIREPYARHRLLLDVEYLEHVVAQDDRRPFGCLESMIHETRMEVLFATEVQQIRDDVEWLAGLDDVTKLGWADRYRLENIRVDLIPDDATRRWAMESREAMIASLPMPLHKQMQIRDAAAAGRFDVLRWHDGMNERAVFTYQPPPELDGKRLTESLGRAVIILPANPTADEVAWVEDEVGVDLSRHVRDSGVREMLDRMRRLRLSSAAPRTEVAS